MPPVDALREEKRQSIVGARRPVYFPWDLTTGRLPRQRNLLRARVVDEEEPQRWTTGRSEAL